MPPIKISELKDPYNCTINIIQACRNGQMKDFKKYKQWASTVTIQDCFTNIYNYTPKPSPVVSFKRRKIEECQRSETVDKSNDEVTETNRQIMLDNYQRNVERYLNCNRDLYYLVSFLYAQMTTFFKICFICMWFNEFLFSEGTTVGCRTNSFYDDKCR